MTEAEMVAKIDALQKENAALKTSKTSGGVYIEYDTYKGQPVMKISGPCPPLAFGRAKAQAIVAVFEDVKKFAEGK